MDMQTSLLDRLFDSGLLIDTGVEGLYGRSGHFEEVIARFEALIDRFGGGDGAEAMRFPPGMNRAHFETSGYMKSFPQLAGTVHSFCGGELDHMNLLQCMEVEGDWTKEQKATEIVLTPAACYPLYPTIARRGRLPAKGGLSTTCNPTASVTSPRTTRPASSFSACGNMSAWAPRSTSPNSARPGWIAASK